MLRLLLASLILSAQLDAKRMLRIAVCGSSRSSEEIELALEIHPQVIVKNCFDLNLDASIRLSPDRVVANSKGLEIYSYRRNSKSLSEEEANQIVFSLLKRLEKKNWIPGRVQNDTAELPKSSSRGATGDMAIQDSIVEFPDSSSQGAAGDMAIQRFLPFSVETSVTLDQWRSGVQSKFYPAFNFRTELELPKILALETRFFFGNSAFRLGEEIIWNQQILGDLSIKKEIILGLDFLISPRIGYFYWHSLGPENTALRFSRHDLSVGAELSKNLLAKKLLLSGTISFLPINLGVDFNLSVRYQIYKRFYLVAQTNWINLTSQENKSSFLSTSFGIGVKV